MNTAGLILASIKVVKYAFFLAAIVSGFLISFERLCAEPLSEELSEATGSTLNYKATPLKEIPWKENTQLRPEDLLNYRESTVPSFASDFHKSILDSDLQTRLEKNYFYELHSFLYFHGYETTSLDVDSKNRFNLDPKEEFRIRTEMAKSISTYFFSRALPRFLKTRNGTKSLGRFYEKTLKTTHVKGNFQNKGYYSWRYSSGMNPINLSLYAQVTNNLWRIAYEDKSIREGHWSAKFVISRQLFEKFTSGTYYQSSPHGVHTFVDWQLDKNLKAGLDGGYYFSPDYENDLSKAKVNLSYRF